MELWVVATRPPSQNGLGLSTTEAAAELMRLKSMFPLLPDTPAIYPVWESLVIQYRVSGKPAHDARLVAAMHVHGLTAILTFDKTGFSRYAGIEVVCPADAAT
jgi:predicted nucleic acid-binding protein